MSIIEIIAKKKEGIELTDAEIAFLVDGTTDGSIPDYQLSAFLMAVYFRGMTDRETAVLTAAMTNSGDRADLSRISGFKVDKHSTGGVGDKTTLIVAPIVASLGVKVAKMSGRGLGHTGGTVDKLESIPNFNTALTTEEFINVVDRYGVAVIGQSANFAPADKRLYAIRDVTATVDSIPLIAASIMSKKIAAGSDGIVLDVKVGSGAFMKTIDEATKLAETMVSIGKHSGIATTALITNMDIPLGRAVGNISEIKEVVSLLSGKSEEDLLSVSVNLAGCMLSLAGLGDMEHCKTLALTQIENGEALLKLKEMVKAQGGDESFIENPEKFPKATLIKEITADKSGYIAAMDAEEIGKAATLLGAGRQQKDDIIDFTAGIYILRKTGEYVNKGEAICIMHTSTEEKLISAREVYLKAISLSDEKAECEELILGQVV